jgi:dihydrofolate reductase
MRKVVAAELLSLDGVMEAPGQSQQDPEENPVAALMNDRKKYVVSTMLEEPLEWSNSTLIKENVAEEISSALKNQPGKDIVISGSATLVRSLLSYGLLDELKLKIHPIVVGGTKRRFDDEAETKPLELANSKTFSTGVLYLTYRPVSEQARDDQGTR